MTANHKIILYVDDDEDDREFLKDAIKKTDPEVEVALANNGLEALDYLSARNDSKAQLPCLIVLDINMPFLNGKETFEKIKEDQRLQQVPVIVFSSSEKPADKQMFNALGVEFFTKPTSISYMNQIVHHMIDVCC